MSQNSQENTGARVSFLIKSTASEQKINVIAIDSPFTTIHDNICSEIF